MSGVTTSRKVLAEADLPVYPGITLDRVCWVDSAVAADEASVALLAVPVVGFDTESKPTFRKGEVSTGPHLVQLATDERVWLFPVRLAENRRVLKQVLESPAVLKVGFGLGNDRSALRARCEVELCNVLDLGEQLRGPGHRGTVGAKVAVAHFFGQKLIKSKRLGTSNWASPRLDERQLLYAANDTHVALQLFHAWRRGKDGEYRDL